MFSRFAKAFNKYSATFEHELCVFCGRCADCGFFFIVSVYLNVPGMTIERALIDMIMKLRGRLTGRRDKIDMSFQRIHSNSIQLINETKCIIGGHDGVRVKQG